MGPPIAPASAYKINRPRTPNEQQTLQSTGSKGGTTPRPRLSTTRSQLSHRSSYSSFASELDERFNIRTDGMPLPYGLHGGTDPRMIQAITQTMIGEYLWKYTQNRSWRNVRQPASTLFGAPIHTDTVLERSRSSYSRKSGAEGKECGYRGCTGRYR
jgi:hypothetical protein